MEEASQAYVDVQRHTATGHIPLRVVDIGVDALLRLPELIATAGSVVGRIGDIVVLSDAVPKTRSGWDVTDVVAALASSAGEVRRVTTVDDAGAVHADERTVSIAASEAEGALVIVTVGSGTVADIGKAVAARLSVPTHLVVQTALSVNGFADDQSVLLLDGVKRTTPTRWPDGLIADTQVLAEAPLQLNLAGLGDLMAMFTAPADWRIANLLGMDDSYSVDVVTMVRAHGPELLRVAPSLQQGDVAGIEVVANILTLAGISMGLAGTTAPASGAEHTVSHLIEMATTCEGQRNAYHGAQVGVASVLAALVWRHVLDRVRAGHADLRCPSDDDMQPAVLRAFADLDESGAMAAECWQEYKRKLDRWRENHGVTDRLDPTQLEEAARWLEEPQVMLEALRRSQAPTRFSQLDPPVGAQTARWALTNCHLMRNRLTIVDLAFMLGIWDPADVETVLEQAASMEAGL